MTRRVPILMYHALDDQPSPISVRPATFAEQMRWLHARGYRVTSLGELVAGLRRGEPLPPRTIVATFDDGFASVYTAAFPVLARYGFSATVFLVADYCGRQNDWPSQPAALPRWPLLTWSQARELDRHGLELAGHTFSHPRLDRLAADDLEREILGSKASLEDRLGHAVELFAYPYGRYDDTVKAIVRRGYQAACSTRLGLADLTGDLYALERVEAYYLRQPRLFRLLTSPLCSPYLSARGALRSAASTVLRRQWS